MQAASPQTKKRIAAVEAFVSYANQFSLLCDDGRGGKNPVELDTKGVQVMSLGLVVSGVLALHMKLVACA
jgi:hypothetical protein